MNQIIIYICGRKSGQGHPAMKGAGLAACPILFSNDYWIEPVSALKLRVTF